MFRSSGRSTAGDGGAGTDDSIIGRRRYGEQYAVDLSRICDPEGSEMRGDGLADRPVVPNLPQAQPMGWGHRPGGGAVAGGEHRAHLAGPPATEPDVDQEPDERADLLMAERRGPDIEAEDPVLAG